ncbi:hypothetical protein OKA06_04065 [Novosphingobium sp. MW5]|nr:hypothetical protein [Novosphingobium sp. MW5]
MIRARDIDARFSGISPAVLIASAVGLLALPSAVLAFSSTYEPRSVSLNERAAMGTITPASVDPALARQINLTSLPQGQVFRFTPAGLAGRPDRSITVAVRVDATTARAVNVRGPLGDSAAGKLSPLGIAPTAYNLGVSRGYQGFTLPKDSRRGDDPALASFSLSAGAKEQPSRFAPRISLDNKENAGRAPRTFGGNGEATVDLGGSYRLGKNLNVTAGVRYSQERDRLVPLTDGRQDSQAVYVGTQFRF